MGSAKVTNMANMAEEKKKSIKIIIKNFFGKKKDKDNDIKENVKHKEIPKAIPVETLLENFKKLEIQKQKEKEKRDELDNFSFKVVHDDELDNFTVKVVDTDRRTERTGRIESHSSQDSGFSEKDADEKDDLKSDEVTEKDVKSDDVIHIKDKNDATESEKDVAKKENDVSKSENDVENTEENDNEDDVIESMQKLKIEDGKKKKAQVVPLRRGPIRNKAGDFTNAPRPYGLEPSDFRQINQVNKHTFSGGQVIVASRLQNYPTIAHKDETNQELQNFTDDLAMHGVHFDGQPFDLDIIQEYLDEKSSPETSIVSPASNMSPMTVMMSPTSVNMSRTSVNMSPTSVNMSPTSTLMSETSLMESETSNLIDEFIKDPNCQVHLQTISTIVQEQIEKDNPIEELENTNHLNYEPIESLDTLLGLEEDRMYSNMFPTPPSTENLYSPKNDVYNHFLTPPRSDTAPSPISDTSLLYQSADYSLSPNSDCEKYQEIPQYTEELNLTYDDESTDKKGRERNPSTSSLSMKNFKDMQKELAAGFTKKECCQINRKPCRQIFQEHLKKLKVEERKSLCLKVASMDLKTVYGVLHHVLLGLSRGTSEEDLHLALFPMLCDRVLSQKPQLFLEDFGLSLLKAAALRCPQRPLLSRYLVQCVRAAARQEASTVEGKDCLFREVDAIGDTLVTACARAGDTYADVLAELLRKERGDTPLFNVQHGNTEGYSALHVACRQHSASTPCLHVVHVLLEHGGADIWKGDSKGGDTAVHMAVNSAACDLPLVLLLFRHLDRKMWKKLAHAPNRSSVTPLDYARCAAKSTTRQNYPPEVLDFLKKCR